MLTQATSQFSLVMHDFGNNADPRYRVWGYMMMFGGLLLLLVAAVLTQLFPGFARLLETQFSVKTKKGIAVMVGVTVTLTVIITGISLVMLNQ